MFEKFVWRTLKKTFAEIHDKKILGIKGFVFLHFDKTCIFYL